LPLAKLLNLICIFAAFNLPDCAAEIALRFRDRLGNACDVERILDLLAAQAQGPIEQPLTYREYLRRFESHDPMFFPPSSACTAAEYELACLRDAAAEIERERDEYAAREQAAQAELEQTRQTLRMALEEARQAREDHAATSTELEQTRQSLGTALEEARQARARITSMESSKFWKLRRIWFRLKRCVGLGMNE
jgi:hypothetical protein